MLVRKLSMIFASAGLAIASVANAASLPARVGARVTNPNYQADDDDRTQGIIAIVLILVIIAAITLSNSGNDGPRSP